MDYKKITLNICGKDYVLQTTENPSYLKSISDRLDLKIKDLMKDSNISMTTAAVLTALDLLDNQNKLNKKIDSVLLSTQILRSELAVLKDKVKDYESKNIKIKNHKDC